MEPLNQGLADPFSAARSCIIKPVLTHRIALIGLVGSLLCQPVLAISLGAVDYSSYLDEPLNASIEILGVEAAGEHSVLVLPANDKELARLGVRPERALQTLQVKVSKLPSGKLVAHIATDDAINDARLNLVLRAQWQGGAIVQKYTLLLQDPPERNMADESEQVFAAAQGDLEMLEVEDSDHHQHQHQQGAVWSIDADIEQPSQEVAQAGILKLGSAEALEFPFKNKTSDKKVQNEALQTNADDIIRRLNNVLDRLRDANHIIGNQQLEIDELNATIVNLNNTIDTKNNATIELLQIVSELGETGEASTGSLAEPPSLTSTPSVKAGIFAAIAAFLVTVIAALGVSRWRQVRPQQQEEYDPLNDELNAVEQQLVAAEATANTAETGTAIGNEIAGETNNETNNERENELDNEIASEDAIQTVNVEAVNEVVNEAVNDVVKGAANDTGEEINDQQESETGIEVLTQGELLAGNEQLIDEVASEFDELAPLPWSPPAANDEAAMPQAASIEIAQAHIDHGEVREAHTVLSAIMADDNSRDHAAACKLLVSLKASAVSLA